MAKVVIDTRRIVDWDTFHTVSAQALGFPNFYGRNMNAWITCMTCLDDHEAGMTSINVEPGGVLTVELQEATELAARCPEQFQALVDGMSFVNWRRLEQGEASVPVLAYFRVVPNRG